MLVSKKTVWLWPILRHFTDSYTWCPCDLTHLFVLVGKSTALNSVLSGTTIYLCQASLLNNTHVVLQASSHVSCQERERHQLRCQHRWKHNFLWTWAAGRLECQQQTYTAGLWLCMDILCCVSHTQTYAHRAVALLWVIMGTTKSQPTSHTDCILMQAQKCAATVLNQTVALRNQCEAVSQCDTFVTQLQYVCIKPHMPPARYSP